MAPAFMVRGIRIWGYRIGAWGWSWKL